MAKKCPKCGKDCATVIQCSSCGYVFVCRKCGKSLGSFAEKEREVCDSCDRK